MLQRDFEQLLQRADEAGVHLEIVGGLPLWEASPTLKHQETVDRIRGSIQRGAAADETGCGCFHFADIYIRFPDDSLKRPDISIFCSRPSEENEAITLVPEAVVEVISQGYEAKDLEIGPRFYLLHGVKDVIVFDPYTLLVLHIRRDRVTRQVSPVTIELECGCRCMV
jgi:Uma2 family endonuclease